uniref:Uncharacterized protein n=1 Tax=Arion vulgaris TaxID=1028688 RepID=A0A0B7ARS5_9EUPU
MARTRRKIIKKESGTYVTTTSSMTRRGHGGDKIPVEATDANIHAYSVTMSMIQQIKTSYVRRQ